MAVGHPLLLLFCPNHRDCKRDRREISTNASSELCHHMSKAIFCRVLCYTSKLLPFHSTLRNITQNPYILQNSYKHTTFNNPRTSVTMSDTYRPRYRSRSPNDRNRAPPRERSPFRSNRDLSPPRDPRGGQGWRSPVRGRYRGPANNTWRRDRRSISPGSGRTSDGGGFNSRPASPRASYRRAPYTGPDLIRDRTAYRRDDRDIDTRDSNRAPHVRPRDNSPSKDSGRDTGSIVSTPRGRSPERSPKSRDPVRDVPIRRISVKDDQPSRVPSPVQDRPPSREAPPPVRQERPRSPQQAPQPPAKPFRPPTGPKEGQGFRQRRFDNDNNYSRPPFLGSSANAIPVKSPNSALARQNSNASNTTSNTNSSNTTNLNANATSFEPAKQPIPPTPGPPPTGPAAYGQPSPAFQRQPSPAFQRQPSPAKAPTGPASRRQPSPAATGVPTGPKALMPKAPRGGGWVGRGGRQSFSYDRRPVQDVTNMVNNANNTNTRWGAAPPRQAQPQTSAFTPATPKNPSPSPTPARTPSISGASTSVPTQSPRIVNANIPTGPRASISFQGGHRGGGEGMDWKPTGPAVSVTSSTATSSIRGPAEPMSGVTNTGVSNTSNAKAPLSSGWGPAPAESAQSTTAAKPQLTTSTSSGWGPAFTDPAVKSATPGSRSSSISSAPPPLGPSAMPLASSHVNAQHHQHNTPSFHIPGWNVKSGIHFTSTTSSTFGVPRSHIHHALASLTPIIPGGKLDPSLSLTGGDPKLEARLVRAREEEERIRRELADKEAHLRRALRGWERAERESWVSGVRSEVAGEALAALTGEGSGGGAF